MITSPVLDVRTLVAGHIELAGSAGAFKVPRVAWGHVSECPPNEVT